MRSGPPRVRRAFVLVLVAGVAIVGPAAATLPASQSTPTPAEDESVGTDATPVTIELTVDVRPDGDAIWTVSGIVPIASDTDREAFMDLATAFERGDEGVGLSANVFQAAAAAASNATGRSMEIRNVTRSSAIRNGSGFLTVQFRWTNFARTSEDVMRVGDAFNTTDGTWLPELGADQTLVIRPPEGYAVESAPTAIRDGTVRWSGPTEFAPGDLSVTYTRSGSGTGPIDRLLQALGARPLLGGGIAVVALAILVAVAVSRRGRTPDGPAPTEDPGTDEADPSDASPPAAAGGGLVDEELLSDEERVELLLEQNGGRMKQATIVTETGWSNAKVSQLLSEMAEADRVDKLRIGRENLISLPEEDVGETE